MKSTSRLDMKRNAAKKKKRKRLFLILLVAVFVGLFAGTGYGFMMYHKAKETFGNAFEHLERGDKSEKREETVEPLKDNVSILLMGVDQSEERAKQYGEAVRTDALLYATFNIKEKSVKLVSIPRDSYVNIDVEGKKDKINHAHAFGGVDATVKTVEGLFDLPVDYYVKINFESFLEIVNSLGGIDVDVPVAFTEQNSKDEKGKHAIHLEKGEQTLNGEQALALARTRHIDSDMERGKRQMLVIDAILKKAISVNSISKMGDVIDAIGKNLKTNMTFDNMKSFYKYGMDSGSVKIDKMQLKGKDDYVEGVYYYILDEDNLDKIKKSLRNHLEYKK